jgi:predicted secreted hydrolase
MQMKHLWQRKSASAALIPLFVLLGLLLASCNVPGVPATAAQLPQVGMPTATPTLPPVRFPQDEAPHRDLTEWWYYTGHLNALLPDGQQHHYGFELVFFQILRSDYPPIYAAHFAISDIARGEFHYDQRRLMEPHAVLPAGSSNAGVNVAINDWSLRALNGHDHLKASMNGYSIDLDLSALKAPTLHNGNGLITYGLGGFSYYYSRTSMAVTGTLLDHQQSAQVSGDAWMDHQWGNFLTLGGGGWDWYSIQLNNHTEMMLYIIRDASGKAISTYVGIIGTDGHYLELPASSLNLSVLDHWTSPTTGITYPSGWRVDINDPQLKASLTLQPELKNQELVVTQSTGNTYWEGAVSIAGSASLPGQSNASAVQGEGYVELTGYHK